MKHDQVTRKQLLLVIMVTLFKCKEPVRSIEFIVGTESRWTTNPVTPSSSITASVVSEHRLILGTEEGGIAVYDRGTWRWLLPNKREQLVPDDEVARAKLPHHEQEVTTLSLSLDGKRMLSTGGQTVILWDLDAFSMIRQLRGPEPITTGILIDGAQSFFSTDHGHVLRWLTDRGTADGVAGFSCGAAEVDARRLSMPKEKRCPYGNYVETRKGEKQCLYPVTNMKTRHGVVARSCREGTLSVMTLDDQRVRWRQGEAIVAMDFQNDRELVLVEQTGDVKRYHWETEQTVSLMRITPPISDLVRIDETVFAVASGKKITIYRSDTSALLKTFSAPEEIVKLQVVENPKRLVAISRRGMVFGWPVTIRTAVKN